MPSAGVRSTLFVFVLTSGSLAAQGGRASPPPPPPVVVQPGAPGDPSKIVKTVPKPGAKYTDADVHFMQGMIGHHAQALEMTALVPARTSREDLQLLARRIEISQRDEIKQMQSWLKARGLPVPDEHAHHATGAKLMPGMLTPDEMASLRNANGVAFDRLFLTLMVKHHEGALQMVKDLLASPGAAQDAEVSAFASDVEADQSMEISRMKSMYRIAEANER